MKKILVLLFLIFISCGNLQENGVEHQESETLENLILNGNYLVLELRSEDIASREVIFNFNDEDKRFSGNAGCNRFGSAYKREGENINFEEVVSTKMYCEGKMEIENEIIKLLPQISAIRILGEEIVLISEEDKQLLTLQKTEKRG